jgi:hypothetical protein
MPVRYGGLFALGFELEPDDDQILARDILERCRKDHIRGPVGPFLFCPSAGQTDSKKQSQCHDVRRFHLGDPLEVALGLKYAANGLY